MKLTLIKVLSAWALGTIIGVIVLNFMIFNHYKDDPYNFFAVRYYDKWDIRYLYVHYQVMTSDKISYTHRTLNGQEIITVGATFNKVHFWTKE